MSEMDLFRHVYSTIRVVPNPASGEFANLAAIAGSDLTGEWTIRSIQNERRALNFCGQPAIVAARDFVSRLGLMIDLDEWMDNEDLIEPLASMTDSFSSHITEAWLAEVAATNRHVVQLSAPHPILAESAEEALDLVFQNMLPEPLRRRRVLTKHALMSSLLTNLQSVGLEAKRDFERKVVVVAAGPHQYRHTMDFAVADSAVQQLTHSWSFQISEQSDLSKDVKAWGWTMRELRENGGSARIYGQSLHVAADVPLEVVVVSPADGASGREQDRYGEALDVFNELGAKVTEHGHEDEVASRAADLLGRL